MIPKKIHYCWFGGNPLPSLAVKCIQTNHIRYERPFLSLICLTDIVVIIQIRLDIRCYLKEVVMPGLFLSLILCSVGLIQSLMIPEDTFSRFLLVFASMLIVGVCAVYRQ